MGTNIYIYIYIYTPDQLKAEITLDVRSFSFLVQFATVSWCCVMTREWWFRVHFIHVVIPSVSVVKDIIMIQLILLAKIIILKIKIIEIILSVKKIPHFIQGKELVHFFTELRPMKLLLKNCIVIQVNYTWLIFLKHDLYFKTLS